MSAGVYFRLTGYTLVVVDAESRLGLNGSIPRALLVVHSGNTTIYLLGFCWDKVAKSIKSIPSGGETCG